MKNNIKMEEIPFLGDRVNWGLHKGHWEVDVLDAMSAIGYQLPVLYPTNEHTLQTRAMQCISENEMCIDQLPNSLRMTVNRYHNIYGVGHIKDPRYFNIDCHNHQIVNPSYQPPDFNLENEDCRLCTRRRAAEKMIILKDQGREILEGLLVSNAWRSAYRNKCPLIGHASTGKRAVGQPREAYVMKSVNLTGSATKPYKQSKWSAGWELCSAQKAILGPRGGQATIRLDLRIEIPKEAYGRLEPRRQLGVRHTIRQGDGRTRRNPQGGIQLEMFNFSEHEVTINRGDTVARILLESLTDNPRQARMDQPSNDEGGGTLWGRKKNFKNNDKK